MKLKELINILSKNDIENLYNEHGTLKKVAGIYNVSPQTISRLMDHYSIKRNNKNLGNKQHFFNEDYFSNVDNQDKAYWLGFIMADGCIYEGTKNTYRLQINLKYEDVSHLNRFQEAINSNYSIQRKEINNSIVAILKINSTKMCKDLMKAGVTERKSLICKFPSIKEELYSHFIRGYFDGDGCISLTLNSKIRKEFSIVGGESMIASFSDILKLDVHSLTNREHLKCVRTSDKTKIIELYNYLYKDCNYFLQRKKKVYDILIYILRSPLME